MKDSQLLTCTYYPFSRCLEANTLKYLLLVFDSVTFLDEVADTEWRKKLLDDLVESGLRQFESFARLADQYDQLAASGAVRVIDPKRLAASNSREVACSAALDLEDPDFVKAASRPADFGLPAHLDIELNVGSSCRPVWQAFEGKLASPLIVDDTFKHSETWRVHVLGEGSERSAWKLSYEAGSAAVLNYYLEAADELNSALVTTSELHHRLLLLKIKRVLTRRPDGVSLLDDADRSRLTACLAHAELIRMLRGLFPVDQIATCTFEQIRKFREETRELRRRCRAEIADVLRLLSGDPSTADYDRGVAAAFDEIKEGFRKFERDLSSVRDKVLPHLAKATVAGAGALAGTSVSLIGGLSMGGIVIASAVASAVSSVIGVEAVQLWTQRRKLKREQDASVLYLTEVSRLLST